MEDSGLILTHPTGIGFDLTPDEAVKLMEFIRVYQDTVAPHCAIQSLASKGSL